MAQAQTTDRRNGHARSALKSRTHDVLDDFSSLRKDMSKLAEAANKAARAEVKHAGKRLENLGRDMRTRASDGAGYAVEQVRTHPGAAIGISLGVGLLIGMLLTRR
jgi:ElaB/YqjD/DUF883 family membrane-anchored ribosome-binding protein